MANFEKAIEKTLEQEGCVSDNVSDAGGLTKYGISSTAFPSEDIRNMTVDRAKQIYRESYWNPISGDQLISQEIAESIFDFGVNAGVKTSIKLAQEVLGIVSDGIVGVKTIYALNTASLKLFIAEFKLAKIQRYVDICDKNNSQKVFFFGWVKRALK